jgi:regulator of protease activity HflC (stomatin/prohibitin superfamily)
LKLLDGIDKIKSKVDIRETFKIIPTQKISTLDNINLSIDVVVFYQIFDPVKSVNNIDDVNKQTILLACSLLRDAISSRIFRDVLERKQEINNHIKVS